MAGFGLFFGLTAVFFRGLAHPGLGGGVRLPVLLVAVIPVIAGAKTGPPHGLAGGDGVGQEGDGVMVMAVVDEDLQKPARRVRIAQQWPAFTQEFKVPGDVPGSGRGDFFHDEGRTVVFRHR